MRLISPSLAFFMFVSPALILPVAADSAKPAVPASPAAVKKCDAHGVKATLCARCKPKLAAAFKAKNDWCSEHERPESQCAICKPELKKEGVKP